ncbi:MAG: hypothetical protein JEY96_19470 [Bacteroidales bacterium]|nr:hypothetical protein [Bacteroidales bacterium]
MKNLKVAIKIVILFTIVLISCEKEEIDITSTELQNNDISESNELIIIGKKREDPYNIKNIAQAYINLKSVNSKMPDIDIKPTHYYLRFLPQDNDEWNILRLDTTLILYDFPLDYEIEKFGTFYHDPSLPEDKITWQYCVVPIKYNIPSIQHELIYEVFIPDYENDKRFLDSKQFLADLEYESVKLTGNLHQDEKDLVNAKGRWKPKGTIKVWDDIIGSNTTPVKIFDHWEYYDCGGNEFDPKQRIVAPIEQCKRAVYHYEYITNTGSYIPLANVSVHARWFTHVERDLTDENGYFETGSFIYEVNYAIKWERGYYNILNGMVHQAWYNGPKKKGDWNLNIGSGKSIMYATIHRAAHKQFYGDNLGIQRPIVYSKINICYMDSEGTGIFWGEWAGGLLPDIKIWGKSPSTGNYRSTEDVFGTTTHELGHLSHWQYIGKLQYMQVSEIVYESWATAVEWALTNDEYHRMGDRFGGDAAINLNYNSGKMYWPVDATWEYSPIFIDLMDEINQRLIMGVSYPNDLISGFSLSYIQNNILNDAYGLSSLRNAIKDNKLSNVTNSEIDELFALYW